jgi:septum formation protein
MQWDTTSLVLASKSAARIAMLNAAGVALMSVAPGIDEDSVKAGLIAQGSSGRDIADALAEAKAIKISRKSPGALVLGSDQVLQLDDGTLLSKADSPQSAKEQLALMAGKSHRLFSAAVICERGEPVWRYVDTVRMKIMSTNIGIRSATVWVVTVLRQRARNYSPRLRAAILQ